MKKQPKYVYGLYNKARINGYKSPADKLKTIVSAQYTIALSAGKTSSRQGESDTSSNRAVVIGPLSLVGF